MTPSRLAWMLFTGYLLGACDGPVKAPDTQTPGDSLPDTAGGGDSTAHAGVDTGTPATDDTAHTGDSTPPAPACEGTLADVRSRKVCGDIASQWVGQDLSPTKNADATVGIGSYEGYTNETNSIGVYSLDALLESEPWVSSSASVGGISDDTSDFFGYALTTYADVDGDGQADLAVGAPGACPPGEDNYAGRVFVYLGPMVGTRDWTTYDVVLDGYGLANQFGAEVSPLPDIDGDGDDELLVGTYGNSSFAHMAQLFLGPITSESRLDADASYERGETSSGDNLEAADVDGDGISEILDVDEQLTIDTLGGVVFIIPSDLRGTVNLDDQMGIFGEVDRHIYGAVHSLAAGDATGDGYNDLVFQLIDRRSGGHLMTAMVYAGPVTTSLGLDDATAQVVVWEELDAFTPRIAGDVDGDGQSGDVVAGMGQSGAVFLFPRPLSGSLTLTDADVIARGEPYTDTLSDMFGFTLAALPDLDADGADELLIGAPRNDEGAADAGAVYLLYGASW